MRPDRHMPNPMARYGTVFLLATIVVSAGVAVVGYRAASSAAEQVAESQSLEAEVDLARARAQIVRPSLDDVVNRTLRPFGVTAFVPQSESADIGRRALEDMAARDWVTADTAREILETLERDAANSDPDNPTVDDSFNVAGAAQFVAETAPQREPTTTDSIRELLWLDQPALFVVYEATITNYALRPPENAPADVEDLLSDAVDLVRDEGGYLGDDPQAPLQDGYIPVDTAAVHEATTVGEIEQLYASTVLWEVDQWIRSWSDEFPDPAPVSLDRIAREAETVVQASRNASDRRLNRLDSALLAQRQASEQDRDLLRALWVVAAAMVALAGIRLALVLWEQTRVLRRSANTDPLTGLGNRNVLEKETTDLLNDHGLGHHVGVSIDMDRFKMINDTYGHATGDLLLKTLASGLRAVGSSGVGPHTTISRIGGDEFFLSVHGENPLDEEKLRHELDQLRQRTITDAEGHQITLAFSYGVAKAVGSPRIDDLMQASDLAAYEDKADRRVERRSTDSVEPAPAQV